MTEQFFFIALPYGMMTMFLVGIILRFTKAPFTQTSLSSQFLEGDMLFWGSFFFHWGIVFLFFFHLFALLLPWRGLRLWILEVTGFGLALALFFGLLTLILRRFIFSKVVAVTRPMDWVVLILLLLQVASGIGIALSYRWGFGWMAHVAGPWLGSLLTLKPNITTIQPLPWLIKFHFAHAFIILGLIPYTRLLHFFSIPIAYLTRPYQVVAWYKEDSHG